MAGIIDLGSMVTRENAIEYQNLIAMREAADAKEAKRLAKEEARTQGRGDLYEMNEQLKTCKSKADIARVLKDLFVESGPNVTSKSYNQLLVAAGYDAWEAYATITWADLIAVGVLRGHAWKVLDAIRGSPTPVPEHGASAQTWFPTNLPEDGPNGLPTEISLMDWGACFCAHLRIFLEPVKAEQVQVVFNAPWDDIAADYPHGDELDARLCAIIVNAGEKQMHQTLVGLVQVELAEGHGLQLLQILCRAFYHNHAEDAPERIAMVEKAKDKRIEELQQQVEALKDKYQMNLDRLQEDRARLKRQMAANKTMFMNQMTGFKEQYIETMDERDQELAFERASFQVALRGSAAGAVSYYLSSSEDEPEDAEEELTKQDNDEPGVDEVTSPEEEAAPAAEEAREEAAEDTKADVVNAKVKIGSKKSKVAAGEVAAAAGEAATGEAAGQAEEATGPAEETAAEEAAQPAEEAPPNEEVAAERAATAEEDAAALATEAMEAASARAEELAIAAEAAESAEYSL